MDGSADEIARVVGAVREGIGELNRDQPLHAKVDFNLADEHSHPTLTARQESLAALLGCAAKTVRRRSEQALAFVLAANIRLPDIDTGPTVAPASEGEMRDWTATLRRFWRLSPHARLDVVCSEIPEAERPEFSTAVTWSRFGCR